MYLIGISSNDSNDEVSNLPFQMRPFICLVEIHFRYHYENLIRSCLLFLLFLLFYYSF